MLTHEDYQKEIQRLQTAVGELSVLNDLALAASSSMEVDQMLDIIVRKSIKAVKAEQGSILLVTEEREKPLRTLIRHADLTNELPHARVGIHITGWVLKHKKPLIIENLSRDDRFRTTESERASVRSVLCVPIWFKAEILGILMVINKQGEEVFRSEDLRLLSIISAQSGQLIRNSQLQQVELEKKRLEHELSLARRIQLSLLPTAAPQNEHLDIASYFHPAEQVGGDYYDFFALDGEKLGVVIADVSGHGPSAAMMMSMLKGILHLITHQMPEADEALRQMNLAISEILPKEMFVSMLLLIIDVKQRTIQLANAGHHPILQCRGNKASWIEWPGCALNLSRTAHYSVKQWDIQSDDLLLIYTDGIPEAMDEKGELLGEEQLRRIFEQYAHLSAEQVIENVMARVRDFTIKAPQADDMALIAIRIKPSSSPD